MHTPIVGYRRALFQLIQLPLQWKKNREDTRWMHMESHIKIHIYKESCFFFLRVCQHYVSINGETFQRILSVTGCMKWTDLAKKYKLAGIYLAKQTPGRVMVVMQSLSRVWLLWPHGQPGSAVHGIFQARILEWVPISFSRLSSQPRDRTHISWTAGEFFTKEPPGKHNWGGTAPQNK